MVVVVAFAALAVRWHLCHMDALLYRHFDLAIPLMPALSLQQLNNDLGYL